MVTEIEAAACAAAWIDAWNAHELDRIHAHDARDAVFSLPFVNALGADTSGCVRGCDGLRESMQNRA